ncbi:MAG TPA: bi-domain-containing oxidoreductase, partial [Anaerolineaceae bacterium]|nr:bi-domain-containing oxidoreductase [Anaerolineaceae bacterium]
MKAKSRPDLVKQVIEKSKREGVIPTIQSALNRLVSPMALGYSSAGVVVAVGEGIENVKPGDRVACAGGGFASHAEYVLIPKNLFSPFSERISFEEAAFSTLGAISLHGFRIAAPQIGEKVAIIGLGLLGLMLVDICKAAGCSVFGIDLDNSRIEIAKKKGIMAVHRENAENQGMAFTNNLGFDAVFICADSNSNDPIELAGSISRDRGNVVAVGAVGLDIPRKVFYEKEIKVHISRSYGPGRYDVKYEEFGQDYPVGYIRWTEGRNLSAVIELIESKKLDVKSLISHRFSIEEGVKAYETITGKNEENFLGVVINYQNEIENEKFEQKVTILPLREVKSASKIKTGILGAGLYAGAVFLPIINKSDDVVKIGICSAKGLNARQLANKFGYQFATTNENEIISNSDINTVVILTRHNDHARQVIESLKFGKHIYCEKPLAINLQELKEIETSFSKSNSELMVGFNRRFAPFIQSTKNFFETSVEPKQIHYRINAGYLPLDHWLHNPSIGGGRIIGEGCHFIDLCIYLVGSTPVSVQTLGLPNQGKYNNDIVTIVISFEDGSNAIIEYLANGDKNVEKETMEIFSGGKVAQLFDYRKLILTSNGKKSSFSNRFKQDKGHIAAWDAFTNAIVKSSDPPIPFTELLTSSVVSIAANESLIKKEIVLLKEFGN